MVTPISEARRAQDAWRRINRWPVQIEFTRPKVVSKTGTTPATLLPAQTLRLETDSRASVVGGEAGIAPRRAVIIFGIRNHPNLEDANMEEGDTFIRDGDLYRITDVLNLPGERQAIAVTTG